MSKKFTRKVFKNSRKKSEKKKPSKFQRSPPKFGSFFSQHSIERRPNGGKKFHHKPDDLLAKSKDFVAKLRKSSGEIRTKFYQKVGNFSTKVRYKLTKVRKFFPKSPKYFHKESERLSVKLRNFPSKV